MRKHTKIGGLLGASLLAMAAPLHAETAPAVVAATTSFGDLTIEPGQIPAAPAGKLLTLTVDGVEQAIIPGHYTGKVVLSVTDDIPVDYHKVMEHHFRAAAFVEDGALVPAKSVQAALSPSTVIGQGVLANARITSQGERFNGIVVTGKGPYRIDHPVIDLTGNGGNDFAGFGAAITAMGEADLTIDRPVIRTHGAIRPAIFVGGRATVHVNDAEIEVLNGTLPANYKFTVDMGKMMEVPWMLGLSGNVRATNLVDYGTVYYNRSHIRAQGWGAVSTDDSIRVRMYVNDSLIEAVESGYGCYSIGDSIDSFTHSIIRAADIGCIMAAQGSIHFSEGTQVEAGRLGVMMHSGAGGGTLTIDKGSLLRAGETAIQVKGIGTTIVVDGAKVQAGNGIILQSMDNDDPFMKAMMSGHVPEGMDAPPPGVADAGDKKSPTTNPDVAATFRNTSLAGDFYNARPKDSALILDFENAEVRGRISSSTVAPAQGREPTRATYTEIGHVINTAGFVAGSKGVKVTLGAGSRWIVTGRSYLGALDIAAGARLESAEGKLIMTVNGKAVAVKPGSYRGMIVLN
ncbi:hypothetical protein [Novosphingobium humi]|uniref:hypothetical protein n=1 Tax=Novosphingobium humi TaxID=2282397 RepID=UPI0025B1CB6D|nr:hypothetical protein [Novosphingobium humi]WJS99884.1 hypothetical protein NYQ05_07030 [Novosphingobium humi]